MCFLSHKRRDIFTHTQRQEGYNFRMKNSTLSQRHVTFRKTNAGLVFLVFLRTGGEATWDLSQEPRTSTREGQDSLLLRACPASQTRPQSLSPTLPPPSHNHHFLKKTETPLAAESQKANLAGGGRVRKRRSGSRWPLTQRYRRSFNKLGQ